MLHALLEILGGDTIFPKVKRVNMKIQRVENINVSLKYIREKGIKLVSIGGEDIYAGNLKLILGLIWTLILRFQIATDDDPGGTKAALLEWVNRQINPQVCSFFDLFINSSHSSPIQLTLLGIESC